MPKPQRYARPRRVAELKKAKEDRETRKQAAQERREQKKAAKTPPPEKTPKGVVATQADLSALLAISTTAIHNFMKAGMPKGKHGFNVEECRQWIHEYRAAQIAKGREHRRKATAAAKGVTPEELDKQDDLKTKKLIAETRKLTQEARGRKLKNDEYEGLLLPADEVRQWVASRFLRIKNRLEMLPNELQMVAPSPIRPQLRQDLATAIHELLLEISGWEAQVSSDDDFSETT